VKSSGSYITVRYLLTLQLDNVVTVWKQCKCKYIVSACCVRVQRMQRGSIRASVCRTHTGMYVLLPAQAALRCMHSYGTLMVA
jgi:hypothetical protein